MRAVLCAFGAFVVAAAFACGGGGGSGGPPGDDVDDPPPTDGPDNPPGDAPPNPTSGLGSTCTPDQANPQGTCPTGFVCLNLMGGTNAWCSKTCETGANDTCAADYTGPGKAQCVLQVTPSGGGAPQNFCSVICSDMTPNNQICPASQCNGTCPGTLACNGPLQDQNMNVVAQACQ